MLSRVCSACGCIPEKFEIFGLCFCHTLPRFHDLWANHMAQMRGALISYSMCYAKNAFCLLHWNCYTRYVQYTRYVIYSIFTKIRANMTIYGKQCTMHNAQCTMNNEQCVIDKRIKCKIIASKLVSLG